MPNEFKIKKEFEKVSEANITPIQVDDQPVIKNYQSPPLLKGAVYQKYSSVKEKFGTLAVTDAEHAKKAIKDRRFKVNLLSRDSLSVEQEERRFIEEQVENRLSELEERVRLEASEAGYEEGLKKGRDEAFNQFQEDAAPRLQKWVELVQEAESLKLEMFRANERFLVELVFRIARMVVLKELENDHEYILRLLRELIGRIDTRENISIQLNPEDMKTMDMLKTGLQQTFGELKNLNIEACHQIARGGCQLDTEWNAIDASVDSQLKGIYDALIGKTAKGTS